MSLQANDRCRHCVIDGIDDVLFFGLSMSLTSATTPHRHHHHYISGSSFLNAKLNTKNGRCRMRRFDEIQLKIYQ